MSRPTGLILCDGPLDPELVSAALNEQGGPEWDRTVFRLLTGVDLDSLVVGSPEGGQGTALSVASSGWWLRSLDELADRLAKDANKPILACFEYGAAQASGWHLARPDGTSERSAVVDGLRAWGAGLAALAGGDARPAEQLVDLGNAARIVHHEAAEGVDLPAVFLFRYLDSDPPERKDALTHVRGTALVRGLQWRPQHGRVDADSVPAQMRSLVLEGPVRLPGPPRWALARRKVAVETAQSVLDEDGWVCLVPEIDGRLARYGAAVRIHQLAPLPDGNWLGVLHPRQGVAVEALRDGLALVKPVSQRAEVDSEELDEALAKLMALLPSSDLPVRWTEDELRESDDPAALLGWQMHVTGELCQRYLAAKDPVERLRALAASLE
jgi:hypothetical protein